MAREQEQSIEQWRKKYYDSLGELEDKEKEWSETESFLRVLVSRLTLIAETEDSKLNQQLEELRQSIREEQTSHNLKRSIEKISANINQLGSSKNKTKQIDPVAPLKSLLDKLTVPEQLKKQERHLRKHLDVADADDIDQVVQNMVELIGYINEFSTTMKPGEIVQVAEPSSSPATEEEQEKTPGFLSSLFLKKQSNDDNEPAAKSPKHEHEEVSIKTDVELSPALAEVEEKIDQVRNEKDVDVRAACETLIDLIEHFHLPNDLAVEANMIKARLESCDSREELITHVENLADLVSEVHKRVEKERSDLEEFLKQLTGRLHEIDTDIRESAKLHAAAHQQSQDINSAVNDDVKGIEASVSEALDLESLKRAIQSRVVILRNHMDKFIEAEEQRHQQSNMIIERLQDRVENMESETETLKEEVRKKQEEATRDALTGVANRLAYNERIASEIARNKRYQTPLTILVWDIDKFKSINDTYGHAAGDKVLKAIAKVLSSSIRETDFIARFGGEEFVVLMPETSIDAAESVANKLRQTIESCEFHFKDQRVVITASCGIAEIKHNESEEQLFERADSALYQAKETGRNKCVKAS